MDCGAQHATAKSRVILERAPLVHDDRIDILAVAQRERNPAEHEFSPALRADRKPVVVQNVEIAFLRQCRGALLPVAIDQDA